MEEKRFFYFYIIFLESMTSPHSEVQSTLSLACYVDVFSWGNFSYNIVRWCFFPHKIDDTQKVYLHFFFRTEFFNRHYQSFEGMLLTVDIMLFEWKLALKNKFDF